MRDPLATRPFPSTVLRRFRGAVGLLPTLRWADYVSPSTLHLAPLLDLLLEPIRSADALAELQLGLQEVLVNAVRHGNGCDPAKCLRVRRILTPHWVVWQVQDEGGGVPHHNRLAQLPECLEAPCGRGFYLIHHCFDDVRWSPRGNRLQVAVRRRRLSRGDQDSPDP